MSSPRAAPLQGMIRWVAGMVAALCGPFISPAAGIAATLPVPCAAGACKGVTGPQTWVTSGAANLVHAGNSMTINQTSERALLNWQSFNISNDGAVTFKQPDAAAVALNQIFQADPSKILGALSANGSIYLINQNGIIFGAGAQVNTGSLIASSLNITPAALSGILNAGLNNGPAFASFLDANGNPLPSGAVQVASGATINAPGGSIMLFGPQVTNQGSLAASGGQVILAAGDSVYLAASTDPNLRGLLVEVGHGGTVTNAPASSPAGSDYGRISAGDGNVTMVGLMVNQLGRVSATTAVQQNGSVYLLAQDGGSAFAQAGSTTATLNATNAGTLILGAGSRTDVTLDLASTGTAVDATAQPKSQVVLGGQTVMLAGGSEITATAGNVSITAAAQPGESPDNFSSQPGTGRLVIDAGASIDVSGANIALPMASNVIAVQLRGTELANSPEQRNGPLYGQTVYIDTRQAGVLNGTAWVGSPIGDLSGYVSAVQRTVAERSLTGGTISLNSDGAVFVAPQASLNISGGSINYLAGYVDTTKLLGTNGLVYDISRAIPNQSYAGIISNYSLTDPKWGVTQNFPSIGSANPQGAFEAGYVEGKDAGAVAIVAPRLVLDADVTANTVIGPFQRQLPGAFDSATTLYRPVNQMPLSGQLTLGLADGGGNGGDNYLLPDVVVAAGTVLDTLTGPTGAPFNPLIDPLPAALDTVQVRPDLFGPNGIGQLALYANGTVTVPSNIALQLPVAGQLAIKAGAIDLQGRVTAHDGAVSLNATTTESIQGGTGPSALTVGAQSAIDVSGVWINDQPAPNATPGTDPLAIGGGSVKISASGGTPLDMQAGSLIDVSGAAQRSVQGKITGGAAGSITIGVGPSSNGLLVPVALGSTLEGYGLTQGGALSVSANAICIAAADCTGGQAGVLWVPTPLFSADGFARISLASNVGGIDVLAGTQISPQQLNFALTRDPATVPSGTPFDALAAPALLPQLFRAPVNVSLAVNAAPPSNAVDFNSTTFATAGILDIERGAAVALDPKASLSLTANSSIVVDGSLSAPGGRLSITTTTGLPIAEFLNSQAIWLQSGAQLSTAGAAQLQTNDLGQRIGSVLNGGNISIIANRGYLITAPGSSIDASGTAAEVNPAQDGSTGGTIAGSPTLVGSNGGTIALAAAEGMLLGGSVASHAGNAPGAAGGALDITLDGNLHGGEPGGPGSAPVFPFNPRQIIVTNEAPPVVAPQSAIPDQYNGIALVPVGMIEAGGFSALQLSARNLFDEGGPSGLSAPVSTASIVFAQDANLQLPASIRLDAPQISTPSGAQVELQAAYVGLGYSDSQGGAQTGYSTSAGPGTSNTGSLLVRADLVDFIGSLGLGGFSSATIDSAGDIRFIGVESGGPTPLPIAGTLVAQGSLVLQADQVYPTTLTQFDVSVAGAPNNAANTLQILPGTSPGSAVLSAGGQLTLQADTITQSGMLRAPFGQLILDAAQITLAPGSVTSTSGAGQTIPFGSTQAGTDWVYSLPQGQFAVYTQSGPPAKSVQLNGNSIVVAKGATINLSGGGDLQASEFVPGVGGTIDVLSNSNAASPGEFAILPLLSLPYAPYDPQSQSGFAYAPGSSVVLAGGGGVAAGTYAILPASYALLPGAYLVRPVSGYTDIAPGQTIRQLDGSTIVSGQFAVAGTDIVANRTQGFDLLPGAAVEKLAQYTLTSANAFFSQQTKNSGSTAPQLPEDAGQLQFSAGQQLEFLGELAVAAAPGGRGAQVDISASAIDVNNGGAGAPGTVALDASQLNALGAQSLLIGGTRGTGGGATQIATTASSVVVDAGVSLTGSEIMLTASDSVTLSAGATLNASGATVIVPSAYDLAGDGTFLRVSSGAQTPIVRSNPNPDPTLGALTIDQGATIMATGSASLEASGSLQSQATYALQGGSLSFTASQISLGAAPSGTAGLVLTPAQLSMLNLSGLDLTSGSPIDIYGANLLAVTGNLTLAAPAIAAASSDAAALLQAAQITLDGSTAAGANGAVTPGGTPISSGTLTLQADHLILSGGATAFTGFAAASLNASAEIRAAGAGSISSDAPLTLHTGLLSTGNGVNFQISSPNGSLQVLGALAPSSSAAATPGAGGAIALSGTDIAIDTALALPSGILQLSASGTAATDNIVLGRAASIDVAGTSMSFDSVAVAGPGGRVSMNAAAGGISLAAGGLIDLSAGNASGAAGALTISAPNGSADLQGTLTATGGTGASAGQFTLDVSQLPDLAGLNAALNAGGFGGLRGFRQRGAGDVVLAPTGQVVASSVSISNDGGSVDVLGSINASGSAGGLVSLSAQNAIEIAGTVNASASRSGQSGGSLRLTSTSGVVHIEDTASIDLAGGAGAAGGTLALTVPRVSLTGLLAGGTGPAAISLGGSIQGVQQVQAEGLAAYEAANDAVANTISAADIVTTASWYTDAAAFMSNAAAIGAALKGASALNVSVVPGIQIQSTGDLTLGTNWDLSTWRFNGGPGILTLRAAGNLLMQNSLSDGFNGVTGAGAFVLPSVADQSWSYRLIGGADLNAANLMAVASPGALTSGTGNIQLAPGIIEGGIHKIPVPVMVRTGTGNIDIAAAGDLQFGNRASVIYTAGQDSGLGIPLTELANLAYPTAGGNIEVQVGGDILGAPTNQLVTSWLWRAGQPPGTLSSASATGWTVNYQWFEENIGALAGGNVAINAGGNISQLSVAVPTIGVQVGGTAFAQNAVQVTGGGMLAVQSGGSITGGSYFLGQGNGTLVSENAVGADLSGAANTTALAPILAVGDAGITVSARTGLTLESVLNPFLLPQATVQGATARTLSLFSTYTDASAVSLVSTAGDITLLDQPAIVGLPAQLNSMRFATPLQEEAFIAYPGSVNAAALTGNLNIDGSVTLWPSPTGNLNLLAGQNVQFAPQEGSVLMSGLDPGTLANPNAPVQVLTQQFQELFAAPAPGAAYTPIHSAAFTPDGQNDPNPVRVVALGGSITDAYLSYVPKSVHLVAGQDITELTLRADHIAGTDISVISAGRDISYASPRDVNGILSPESQSILIEGPGSLLVEAGGSINLGTSTGITTVGNLYDPAIAAGGANVSVLAGATAGSADLADFIAHYLTNATTYDALLIGYVQARSAAPVATKADAVAIFQTLPLEQQFLFCQQILYDEVRTGGRAAAAPGPGHGDYSRSFLALSTLFPNSTTASGPHAAPAAYPGSLSLYFSQIYTIDGGDISLLVPGGGVNVGLSTPPAAFGITKTPSELGIVAQSTGDLNSVSYGNFLVNQSRVFAADGGNILVWSTDGNVDAGRGAKTAISAPAPIVTFNAQGQIQTTFPAALEGSGIQALATTVGVSPGDVDLYAPQGVVNASDAGIVAGNLTIGATAVLGRNNITVSGVSVGVPVDASGLGASLAGSSSVSSSASNAATMAAETNTKSESSAPLAQSALGFLDVFVIGLGEENCKQDDIDCLKRQKAN